MFNASHLYEDIDILPRHHSSKIILRHLENIYCKPSTCRCFVDILKMSYQHNTTLRQSKDVLKMPFAGWEVIQKVLR